MEFRPALEAGFKPNQAVESRPAPGVEFALEVQRKVELESSVRQVAEFEPSRRQTADCEQLKIQEVVSEPYLPDPNPASSGLEFTAEMNPSETYTKRILGVMGDTGVAVAPDAPKVTTPP